MPSPTAPGLSKSSSPPAWKSKAESGPGFAVYVHWPFCQSKCPYCDFNSYVRKQTPDEPRFVEAYLSELDYMAALAGPREVESVFFGGGTPSLMRPSSVDAILERIALNWRLAADAEISLEANPTSVEAKRLAGFRAAGVNRVSLGIQSFDDEALKRLGRLHTAQEARTALDMAQKQFSRVSFDLIYARPGQTPEAWRRELRAGLNLGAGHLSLYQLTIEPGTPFAELARAGKLKTPEEDEARALYEVSQDECTRAGLVAYEISNHARRGQECRHNLVYWRMGDYAGVGPGAHGRICSDGRRYALVTHRSPETWHASVEEQGHGIAWQELLSDAEAALEYLLMAMRLSEGLDIARYQALGGTLEDTTVAELEGDGLVRVGEGRVAATAKGRLLLNSVIERLAG